MFKGEKVKTIGEFFNFQIQNIPFIFQDNLDFLRNITFYSLDITEEEKDFISDKNKLFFKEFIKAYKENLELNKKLIEINEEKKIIKDKILKLENEINNKIKCTDKKFIKIITPYKKKKRKRRKKCEIIAKYKCIFNNCNKSYLSISSLNMHIKLKH